MTHIPDFTRTTGLVEDPNPPNRIRLDIKGTTIDIKASCGAPLLIAKGFETRQQMQLQFPSKAEAASWLQALQFETHRHGLGKDDEETF